MDANLINELIGRQVADYINSAQRAGQSRKFSEAADAQASAETLMRLQCSIKTIMDEASAATKPVVPAPASSPKVPVVTLPTVDFGSGKDWSLDGGLKPGDIDKMLARYSVSKGKAFRVSDDPSKVKFSWRFVVNGKNCAIWDYKGTRWSGFGPKECFEALGFRIC